MSIQDRKNREREQRQQLIIAAAKKVVDAKGFRNTTIEHIARKAEISPGTIYLYFKNKEELFSSLVLHTLQFLELRIQEVCDTHAKSTFENKISALHKILLDAYRFDPLISINMFHLLSVENLKCITPSVLCQVKLLFNSMRENLTTIFDGNKDITDQIVRFEGVENLFFILLSGLSIWAGISNQILEDSNRCDYSESCNTIINLVLEVSQIEMRNASCHSPN